MYEEKTFRRGSFQAFVKQNLTTTAVLWEEHMLYGTDTLHY